MWYFCALEIGMKMQTRKQKILGWGYRHIAKPIFFLRDPEAVHDGMIFLGKKLGNFWITKKITAWLFDYQNPALAQTVCGIHLRNPVGLAAGFDKNAELLSILPSVGFGFIEIGSVTGEPCEGNAKPRLWRLKKSKSIAVYYGLKNDGAESIVKRIGKTTPTIPVGVSIAKTNCALTVDTAAGIFDYVKALGTFQNWGSYITVNISCPNVFGGEPFTDAPRLDLLLTQLDFLADGRPVFLKLAAELSEEELGALYMVCERHKVDGFICSNLMKKRSDNILDTYIPEKGGLSGKLVENASDKQIAWLYKKAKGKYVIIGLGGIFSAEDAYRKIRLGSNLVQLITGMIFEGPQLIGEINYGLVQLLKRDGFKHISEAVGIDTHI